MSNHPSNHPSFSQLGVAEPLCRALAARNYHRPTPIQARAIPLLLDGRDIVGVAQTGTGKTAAFALPILQLLGTPDRRNGPRALVLAPTRELAIQIADGFKAYGANTKLRLAVIFGGVSQRGQVDRLRRGVDIIVATPGRLLDLMNQGHAALGGIQHLVLDEADRMLDMGFIRDVRKIIAALPHDRQALLFSATMPAAVERLTADILHRPTRIDIVPKAVAVESIRQSVHFVDAKAKLGLLRDLMADQRLSRVIVFTRTKHRANRVADNLVKAGIAAEAIHGNKSQGARQRALESFRQGRARVLVATDIAARGIDVVGVTHVINFELPNEPESYVHRIGRTARAGASGVALSFCDASEYAFLRDIEALIRMPITVDGGERPSGVVSAKPAQRGRGRAGRQRNRPRRGGRPARRAA
ncbi:MAG: DEAD/DEAH box helicase [Alphaproteobacteria bacterium]|nr:MAG: DEAD/DEAH box helicase [Alphaproteobacteria bacterium]